jgi:hypothetical protein
MAGKERRMGRMVPVDCVAAGCKVTIKCPASLLNERAARQTGKRLGRHFSIPSLSRR